jgi:hypothetical protein
VLIRGRSVNPQINMENPATLAVAVAFMLALFGAGVSVAYFVGRKGGIASVPLHDERKLPDRYAREIEQCLTLGGQAARDAEALAAHMASQKLPAGNQVTSAVEQLIKTAKNLSERVNQIGSDAKIPAPKLDPLLNTGQPAAAAADAPAASSVSGETTADSQFVSAYLDQQVVDSAPGKGELPPSAFDDARQFKRSSFRGAVKATIYPREAGPGREPVHCTVLTRDLSCGGIGIAHTEQLFPKQIVVIDAVGKLLVGEVRWCRREDENFYVAGCRLVKTSA